MSSIRDLINIVSLSESTDLTDIDVKILNHKIKHKNHDDDYIEWYLTRDIADVHLELFYNYVYSELTGMSENKLNKIYNFILIVANPSSLFDYDYSPDFGPDYNLNKPYLDKLIKKALKYYNLNESKDLTKYDLNYIKNSLEDNYIAPIYIHEISMYINKHFPELTFSVRRKIAKYIVLISEQDTLLKYESGPLGMPHYSINSEYLQELVEEALLHFNLDIDGTPLLRSV